jgi:hypothetical protein
MPRYETSRKDLHVLLIVGAGFLIGLGVLVFAILTDV